MSSDPDHKISQEDAEALVRMPTQDDLPFLSAKSSSNGKITWDGTRYKWVEKYTLDTTIHSNILAAAKNGRSLQRKHVMLAFDTKHNLLVALVPVVSAHGTIEDNTYRILSKDLMKKAYSFAKSRFAVAIRDGNVETVCGVRQFMFPSALLLSEVPRVASTGSAVSVLGSSAAKVASVNRDTGSSEGTIQRALEIGSAHAERVLHTCGEIRNLCDQGDASSVPGIFCGKIRQLGDDGKPKPVDFEASTIPSDCHPVIDLYNSDARSRHIDLLNHAASGNPFQINENKLESAQAQKFLRAQKSALSEPTSSPTMLKKLQTAAPPSTPNPGGVKRPADSVKQSEPKRSADDTPKEPDNAMKLLCDSITKSMPSITTGLLSPNLPATVFAGDVIDAIVKGGNVPAFAAAGSQLAEALANPERAAKFFEFMAKFKETGISGLTEKEQEAIKPMLVTELLNLKPRDAPTILTQKIVPLLAFQFVAAILCSRLQKDIERDIECIASTLIAPVSSQVASLTIEVNAGKLREAAHKAQIDEFEIKLAELTKQKAELEKQLEEAKKVPVPTGDEPVEAW